MHFPPIYYLDRETGKKEKEEVYGEAALALLYGSGWLSRLVGRPIKFLVARFPFFSKFYGKLQDRPSSRKKVKPFVETYGLDPSEFVKRVDEFSSFNDFFVRKLKPEGRPIARAEAVLPADGRYWFFPNVEESDGFIVKGHKFSLATLLRDEKLAKRYARGSMVLARLCPVDYHRFHFPCNGVPAQSEPIPGPLASVNPISLISNIHTLAENKRSLTRLTGTPFGEVLVVEVGATAVGTIHQTHKPGQAVAKGEEKGFFSFGGSAMVLLFEPNRIQFDQDLLSASSQGFEIKCLMGQSMGTPCN